MSTHLYCLLSAADAAFPPAGLRGLQDAPIRGLSVRGSADPGEPLLAWVSTVGPEASRSRAEETARNALLHHAVIQAALDSGRSPLPVRFGQRFADDDSCRAHLAALLPELRGVLAKLEGMVQMRVLVSPTTAVSETGSDAPHVDRSVPAAGRRYLEALRARAHHLDTVRRALEIQLDRIDAAVAGIAGQTHRLDPAPSPTVVYRGTTHLVHRSVLGQYRRVLAGVILSPGWRLVTAGPEPPYSFSTIPPTPTRHDSGSATSSTP